MLFERFGRDGPERVEPDAQLDLDDLAAGAQARPQLGREVQTGGRRRRAARAGANRPSGSARPGTAGSWTYGGSGMRPACLERALELVPGERRPHEPAALPERLDRLDRELAGRRRDAHAGAHAARGAHERLPESVRALLEQQHLPAPAARSAHRDARAQHAARVGHDEIAGIEQIDELGEATVLDRPVAPVHEQARGVPALGGPLRDQLLGQRVVELVGPHASSLAGDRAAPANGIAVIGTATDEVLVRRAATGQREAFDELVRRHRARVYALALRICRNPDDAEDALQETFIAAYRALPRFDRRARVSTWLYRIATNKCYDILARRRPTADPAALPGAGRSARSRSRAAGSSALLTQALDALPEQFREAALLCDVLRPHAGRGGRGDRRAGGHHEIAQLPRSRPARDRACARPARNRRRRAGSNRRGRTSTSRELPGESQRALAPSSASSRCRRAVEARLDARLAAELDLVTARRRAGRGGSACGSAARSRAARGRRRGDRLRAEHRRRRHRPAPSGRARCATPRRRPRPPIRPPRKPRGRDAPAHDRRSRRAPAKTCAPASRTAGDRPRPGCPGARGGHARAV